MHTDIADLPPLAWALAPREARAARHAANPQAGERLDEQPPLWTALARASGKLPPAGRRLSDPIPTIRPGEGHAAPACLKTGPRFDVEVPSGGYAWWYIDAMSDDGRYGLTIIAFVGSVFSPYYVSSGKQRPEDHVAMNVALYGGGKRRWAMTERGAHDLDRSPNHFRVGPSQMNWDGGCLSIDIVERGAVFGEPVRGRIRLHPEALVTSHFELDPEGRHSWHPIAARARVEVAFERPGVHWSGDAYLDSNFGSEPMERGFRNWQWSRAHVGREAAIFYEGVRMDGSRFALSLGIDRAGFVKPREAPPLAGLRPTGWLMPRAIRSDGPASVLKTWEDAPFYARSAVETRLDGQQALAVHESLSLTRFISPPVQFMLPFRMPRRT
ncbi:MAG: hydratase [Sandaracinobacteroides sp.]